MAPFLIGVQLEANASIRLASERTELTGVAANRGVLINTKIRRVKVKESSLVDARYENREKPRHRLVARRKRVPGSNDWR